MTEESARETNKRSPEEGVPPRGKWANNREFILSMAAEIIGLGTVWRFPYLCYKNGGGAFFIPYLLVLFLCGIPVFFLETALGQYTSEGGVTAWRKICPMFQGLGVASQVIVAYLNIYHVMGLAWAVFYLFYSFKTPLAWASCENWWNSELCFRRTSTFANPHLFQPGSNWSFLNNSTSSYYFENDNFTSDYDSYLIDRSPETEFWNHRVLRAADDLLMGQVNRDLAGCLLLVWIVCYFCIFKGIKSMGKVVYVTATVPYLMLFILFIRGVTLPGAGQGIKYYLIPDFSRLADPYVWHAAVSQVFFSYAVCQGVMTSLGSYNKYNNNCYRDCLVLCGLNTATSIFAGFVVFSVIGFVAHDMNVSINEVVAGGPSLVFIAFPKALSLLPGSSFWAVLFFLMVLFLGLDTQFVCVESLATAISDLFPRQLRRKGGREMLVLVIVVVCFLLGLPFITEGGITLFHLVDNYGPSGICYLLIASCETIVIAWVYGADRFYDNIEDMIGYRPFPVLKYCWLFITPLICGVSVLIELANPGHIHGYNLGTFGRTLATILMITPLICIPAFILVSLYKNAQSMTTPSSDLRQARPHKPILTLCKRVIFRAQVQPDKSVEETNEKMMMGETSKV